MHVCNNISCRRRGHKFKKDSEREVEVGEKGNGVNLILMHKFKK